MGKHSPPADATRYLVRAETPRLVELCAVLEGYDDLCYLRAPRSPAGIVEAWVSPGEEAFFEELIAALGREGLPAEIVERAA